MSHKYKPLKSKRCCGETKPMRNKQRFLPNNGTITILSLLPHKYCRGYKLRVECAGAKFRQNIQLLARQYIDT